MKIKGEIVAKLKLLLTLAAVLIMTNVGICNEIIISTENKEGIIHKNYAHQLEKYMNKQGVKCKLIPTKGSMDDLTKVVNGYAHVAIVSELQYYTFSNLYMQANAYLSYIGSVDGLSRDANSRIGIVINSTLPMNIQTIVIRSAKCMMAENMKKGTHPQVYLGVLY